MTDLSRLSDEERQWWEMCEKATPQDWRIVPVMEHASIIHAGDYSGEGEPDLIVEVCSATHKDDAAFIVAARAGWPETLERLAEERRKWPAEMAKVTALGDECTPQEVGDFIADLTNVAMERLSYGAEQKQRAEAAEQRIAELEKLQAHLSKLASERWDRITELETKLAALYSSHNVAEEMLQGATEAERQLAEVQSLFARITIHGNCPLCNRGMPGHHAPDCEWLRVSTPQGAAPQKEAGE